ncbi:glomulin isoform X1 [Anoplophora glabripennis]|uniref:glomulin isoform X1 n=1 Tax=Anoplophora glabripennis TaxID=217634 RepID=UPI0008756AEA|nr:glomulin isoform X1 [Anoplophora glabripennis]
MENTYSDFVKNIQESLKQGNTEYALEAFRDNKYSAEIQNNSWDLVPVICEFLTASHKEQNSDVFKCCEQLINVVADNSNPEEALLQFIEEIEESTDDTKFLMLLTPIQKIIFRIPKKRLNSLAWCLNAIQTYINKCEVPEDVNLVGKEKLLLDNNEDTQRIVKLYSELLVFYDGFLNELETESADVHERSKIICKFLVQLLGKPLVYLDMEIFDGVKSKARLIAENLVVKIFKVVSNPLVLIEMRFDLENTALIKPNTLGIAVLFYLVYSQEILIEIVPKVYCPIYFFQNCLHLVTSLLEINQQMCTEKGLALALALMQRIKFIKLSYLLLDSEDHYNFCMALTKIIIYNQVDIIRKSALNIYQIYINSFEIRGFYLLIYNLISTLDHSGLIGFTITQYKDRLAQEFSKNERNMSEYFKGSKLLKLLRRCCYLHKNEESDLIELSDQIMATLNLLRYLALRDKNNTTQIWNYFDFLDGIYFKPLRKGIDLSRAHYELKIKELQEESALRGVSETSVTVGGQRLLEMPKNEKLKVLYSSLTAFDIMDSILSRLIECIEARK